MSRRKWDNEWVEQFEDEWEIEEDGVAEDEEEDKEDW